VLVCSFHHRAIHERGFALRWSPDGRRIETLRPDRSVIDLVDRRARPAGKARPVLVLQ
jgi:hypothetical protein